MNNKRTITTREQIKINGEIRERTATHIVTGALLNKSNFC
ncbi:hypothetical protein L459_05183 [Klebsiella pneumoniae BIDMC 23]|nr:hypothetical protein L459_05183 [Klebsiella pneumoniae BIDMC 23]